MGKIDEGFAEWMNHAIGATPGVTVREAFLAGAAWYANNLAAQQVAEAARAGLAHRVILAQQKALQATSVLVDQDFRSEPVFQEAATLLHEYLALGPSA